MKKISLAIFISSVLLLGYSTVFAASQSIQDNSNTTITDKTKAHHNSDKNEKSCSHHLNYEGRPHC